MLLGKRQCSVSEGICCLEYLLCGIYSPKDQTQPGRSFLDIRLLGNFHVSQVAGFRCTLLAGNSSLSPAGSVEQINFSQQSPKMLKMASKSFTHALLLLLLLKITKQSKHW